jgi:hypothetical protein
VSRWQPIETAPEYVTVLTQHVDDLYPVPAFRIDGHWLREAEGPEDTENGRPGKYGVLYRIPTHWMPLPDGPVSGAGLTEAGVPPLTLVSPGTPSEPSASPAAETLGDRDVRGVEGHAAFQTAGDLGAATQPCEPPVAVLDTPRIAGIKPGRTSLAPDDVSLPARPHGGPEDQAGAAAPAYAAFAPGEQCGEPGCFCMRFFK